MKKARNGCRCTDLSDSLKPSYIYTKLESYGSAGNRGALGIVLHFKLSILAY